MAYKQLEDKYPLHDFKRDGNFVDGRMGPHGVKVDQYLDVFILGNLEKDTNRRWVANMLPGGFFFSMSEGKKNIVFQVLMDEGKPLFKKEALVDERLFARATSGMEEGDFLSLEGVKKALELHDEGKLSLAAYGDNKTEKEHLKNLRGIVRYKEEIEEAARIFLQQDRIKEHPEVIRLRKEKGEVKPLDDEKAEVLAAIGFIEESGGKAIKPVIMKVLKERGGSEGNYASFGDIMKLRVLVNELEEQGYIRPDEKKGRVLTDMGKTEVENYNNKKKSLYTA